MKFKPYKLLLALLAIPFVAGCNKEKEPDLGATELAIITQPTPSQTINFPEGFTLSVGVNDENLVKSYQWQLDNGAEDAPFWENVAGYSASTNTLVKLATEADTRNLRYRCIVTDTNDNQLISDNAYVYIANRFEAKDVITLAGYAIYAGETFDLTKTSLGSGTVKYHENGYEVTLNNVSFDNSYPIYDYSDTSNGLNVLYYDCPHEQFIVNVEGVNVLTNTYWQDNSNSGGMVFSFQFMNNSVTQSVTFQGDGTLSMTGGTHLIYCNRKLNINCDMVMNKISDRYATGIYAQSIEVMENVSIDANLNGYLFRTKGDENSENGDIIIDEGVNIACVSSIPHVSVGTTDYHFICARTNLIIKGSKIDVIVRGDKNRFGKGQGAAQNTILKSVLGDITITDSQISSRLYTNDPESITFLNYTFIQASQGSITSTGNVLSTYVNEDNLYCALGLRAKSDIILKDTDVDITIRADGPIYGISTNSSLTVDNSKIRIDCKNSGTEGDDNDTLMGIVCVGLTFTNGSVIDVSVNRGMAILVQVDAGDEKRTYEEDYVPTVFNKSNILVPTDGVANVYSYNGSIHNYVYMETIYSTSDKVNPARNIYLTSPQAE